jgi:histone deacetylase complex subunit SAP18
LYSILIGKVPPNELQIYTWMDASLRELTSLVREVNPESRKKGTYFDFSVISPQNGRGIPGPNGVFCHYASRDIGTTVSGTKGMDDNKTLAQARFVIGDYVDIAITPPNPGGGGRAHRLDRIGGKLIHIFYTMDCCALIMSQ